MTARYFRNMMRTMKSKKATRLNVLFGCAVILLAVSLSGGALGQEQGPCDTPEARAFDFWIGDWKIDQRILQQDGTWLELPAKTSVSKALDGCALVEHWEGEVLFFWEGMKEPEPMKGFSIRTYDPETEHWQIHWMDTRSPRFAEPYTGN